MLEWIIEKVTRYSIATAVQAGCHLQVGTTLAETANAIFSTS